MSVDVSPDGQTLVFDLLGDLYTLPITGGAATRITSGQAFDAMPSFSPDGKHIAFVSDRSGASNLWVANADGSQPRQLSHTEGFGYDYVSPTWTPDANAVVVSHNVGPANTGLTLRGFTPFELYSIRSPAAWDAPNGRGGRAPGVGVAHSTPATRRWFAGRRRFGTRAAARPRCFAGPRDAEIGAPFDAAGHRHAPDHEPRPPVAGLLDAAQRTDGPSPPRAGHG
jgi:dipeptidyl aminopeptidase/acylaminoacyl peptidase